MRNEKSESTTIGAKEAQQLVFNKRLTQTIIKAVRIRLEAVLRDKEAQYQLWQDRHQKYLNQTQCRDVRRNFEKMIAAYRLVIFDLTPLFERGPMPSLIYKRNREPKKKKEVLLLPPSTNSQENVNSKLLQVLETFLQYKK